jgi:monoamine oxidase
MSNKGTGRTDSTEHEQAGSGLTRRGLIAGAAVAGAAAALPAGAEAARHKRKHSKHSKPKKRLSSSASPSADVIVVGAGVAGLTAARQIVKAGKSAIVLEARNRVGGRVFNHDLGGGKVTEAGAEYVGPTQDHILALAKELGVGLFDAYDTGDNVYLFGGQRLTYSDTSPAGIVPLDPVVLADAVAFVALLDQMSTAVPVDAPWEAPSARDWDGQTLETFAKANSTYLANSRWRDLLAATVRGVFGCEAREVSLLYALFYIASSGNETNPGTFERNFNTRNGAQQWRMVGGTQQVPLRMAAQLGSQVMLGQPVRRIVQSGGGVQVVTDGFTASAKRVVVALAPSLAGRISYEPLLPVARDALTQRFPVGNLVKLDVIYDRPFWRDAGLTGTLLTDRGPANVIFDSSPPDGSPGVLLGFVGGDAARYWMAQPLADRRNAMLATLAEGFGSQALNARGYIEMNWTAEEFSRGCPVGVPPPGTLVDYGASLRDPVGAIHWAGTETSTYWAGYMDGAVRSGERAAREALAEL